VPGRGPVKIAAALAVAAAGFGGGFAYKKFKAYLDKKQVRKERRRRAASTSEQRRAVRNAAASKSRKRPTQTKERRDEIDFSRVRSTCLRTPLPPTLKLWRDKSAWQAIGDSRDTER
jgi:hypothetical protein